MKLAVATLFVGYILSQFYRAFLAVLSPVLQADLGVTAGELASASGFFFLGFALMQIPIGVALDRIGPRLTAGGLLGLCGGGGAFLFGMAQSAVQIDLAMAMIGAGCAPVLMAALYLFARFYPPQIFGTVAGLMVGIGSVGNLAAAMPLSMAVEAFGWRASVMGLGAVTVAAAVGVLFFVKDPPRVEATAQGGSLMDVLRQPAVWGIFGLMVISYAPAAAIRGLWIGPYFHDIFALSATGIGTATLLMGVAMIAGNLAYGPMDRVFGTRKGVIAVGNVLGVACLAALWWQPNPGYLAAITLICAIGALGMAFPLMMAHGRAFFPPHLIGRGVTLLNFCSIGGTGVWQMLSGKIHAHVLEGGDPAAAYSAIFGFFALLLGLGGAIYILFAKDRTD